MYVWFYTGVLSSYIFFYDELLKVTSWSLAHLFTYSQNQIQRDTDPLKVRLKEPQSKGMREGNSGEASPPGGGGGGQRVGG